MVFPVEYLKSVPDWWINDMLLALALEREVLFEIETDYSMLNEQDAILIVSAGEAFEQQGNRMTLPENLSEPNVKKRLWKSLSELLKDESLGS